MVDQPVAKSLPANRTPPMHNKLTDIRAESGTRNHDPSVSADEDSSCIRTRGQCDRIMSEIADKLYIFPL
jgi:hypothetical protein